MIKTSLLYRITGCELYQSTDQLDLRFTLIRFWFEIESTNEWITIHLPLIFDSQVNHDSLICESLVDSISNQKRIKVNRESSWSEPWASYFDITRYGFLLNILF